jgi:hypothetical protein
VRSGLIGNFLYHKKSGLIFAHTEFGFHQLLLAHLAALHKTDYCREHVIWNVHQFPYADPMRQLADDYVREGYGLFVSSVSNGKRITVTLWPLPSLPSTCDNGGNRPTLIP